MSCIIKQNNVSSHYKNSTYKLIILFYSKNILIFIFILSCIYFKHQWSKTGGYSNEEKKSFTQ